MRQEDQSSPIRFGPYVLDLAAGLLMRAGEPVHLRRKAYALLEHLARNRGRVVGKAELMEAVWPGVYVTEDSLTQAVRDIRKALGGESQAVLHTVAGRGYALAGEAVVPEERPGLSRIAVLASDDPAAANQDKLLGQAFADELRGILARFRSLSVVSKNTFAPIGSDSGSDRAGPDYLVRVHVTRDGDTLSIHVELADGRTSGVLWSQRYATEQAGPFASQHGVCLAIASRLVARVADADLARIAGRPPGSLAAWELVQRGAAWLRGYRPEDNLEARRCFEEAIARDRDCGLAHSFLALTELIIGGYANAPREVFAASIERASLGVTLSPEEPRGHRMLGMIRLFARHHEAAEGHMRRALDLNPHDPDTMVQMGFVLTMRGRPLEALEWQDRAFSFNPIHPDYYHFDRSMALYSAGRYGESIAALGMLSIGAPNRWTRTAAAYAQLGDLPAARRYLALATVDDFSPLDYALRGVPFENAADTEHLADGVRKAMAAAG